MPERRDVLPEPEMRLRPRVQGGAVPTVALRGGQGLQRRHRVAALHRRLAALHSARLPASHAAAPLSRRLHTTHDCLYATIEKFEIFGFRVGNSGQT